MPNHALFSSLTLPNFLAVALGGAAGACFRWVLGMLLNPWFVAIPLGTLVANCLGGYLVGLFLGLFQLYSHWPLLWKLLVITGFLGGLTTFSTFSAEVVERLMRGQWVIAFLIALFHLAGSLLSTYAGFMTTRL